MTRFVAAHHPVANLCIDFTINGFVHDAMDARHLSAGRLQAYLRRGVIQTEITIS
jgi:hypothetical protein